MLIPVIGPLISFLFILESAGNFLAYLADPNAPAKYFVNGNGPWNNLIMSIWCLMQAF
jgi:hypothetical protein